MSLSLRPRTFTTDLTQACDDSCGLCLEDFKTVPCGKVPFEKAGPLKLDVTSGNMRGGTLMHLRAVTLAPAVKIREACQRFAPQGQSAP